MSMNPASPARATYSRQAYKASAVLLAALALAAQTPSSQAATITKLNNANALDLGTSWSGGTAPGSSDIAAFSSVNTASSATTTIGAGVIFQGIAFTNDPGTNLTINTGTGGTLSLGSSGIDLSLGSKVLTFGTTISLAADQTWTTGTAAASTSQIVANGVISGTGKLTIAGTSGSPYSPVYLNALNTFSGGVTLNNGGSIRLSNSTPTFTSNLPTASAIGTGNFTINGGVIFGSGSTIGPSNTTINNDFGVNVGTSGLNGRFTIGGGTVDMTGSTRTISLGRYATASAALVSGGESLRFLASAGAPALSIQNGTLRLVRETASTNTATDFVSVNFGTSSNFAAGTGLTIGDHVITSMATGNPFGTTAGAQPKVTVESGGYFNMSDSTVVRSPQIRSLSGAGTATSLASGAGTSILTINTQPGDSATFSGAIVNGSSLTSLVSGAVGVVAVTKTGVGTQILSGSGLNTYSGATTINGGVFGLGANNSFSANSAITLTSGTVDLSSFSTSAASLDFKQGTTLKFDLTTPGNVSALLALAGNFTKTSGTGTWSIDFTGATGGVGTYKLISFVGSTTFTGSEFSALLPSGYTGNFVLGANDLSYVVTASAIPEPSTFAALAGLGVLGLAAGRRRRSA